MGSSSTIANVILILLLVITCWAFYSISLLIVGFFTIRSKNKRKPEDKKEIRELPKMSIIVPVKNEQRVIRRILDSLLRLRYPDEKVEIIVVEDGSSDRTPDICQEYASKYPSKIKFFRRFNSTGKPGALNFALKHVTGDVVAVLDADNVPEPDFLINAAKYFEDPSVAAVQGVTDALNSKENLLTKLLLYEHKLWFEAFLPGKERVGLFVPLAGNCQFVRREVLESLGGWDENSLTEDIELTVRLAENHNIRLALDVKSWQEMPRNLASMIRQRLRWYRGYMETLGKHAKIVFSGLFSRRGFDEAITLSGPIVLSLYFLNYLTGVLSAFSPIQISSVALTLSKVLTYSTLIMLFLAGISVMIYERKLSKILWLPLIFLYWILQNLLAFVALCQVLLRRPREWVKTPKTGSITLSGNIVRELGLENYMGLIPPRGLVVCFVTSYPPNRARLSEYAENVLQEISKMSSIEKIYVIADESPSPRDDPKGKIEIRPVWKHDDPLSILRVLKEILKIKPDIVHYNVHFQSFGRTRIANFIGLSLPFLTKLIGRRSMVTIHNLGEKVDLPKCGLEPSLLNRVGIRLATKLISMANFVTVTVPSYVEYLKNRYRCDHVIHVPHGTYVNYVEAVDLGAINPRSGKKKILMFGHMAPYKGLPILLKAFQELLKERDDVELVVAGDDHPNFPCYLSEIKKMGVPKVKFLGYVPEGKIPDVFKEASLVVLPYLTATGTSGVFHLACGFGKPIVASDLPEIRELIREGASALLIPKGDFKRLKEAISYMLDNPELMKEMGKKNLAFAQRESWEDVAKRFGKIYHFLANGIDTKLLIEDIQRIS